MGRASETTSESAAPMLAHEPKAKAAYEITVLDLVHSLGEAGAFTVTSPRRAAPHRAPRWRFGSTRDLPGSRADIGVLDYQPITPMTASNLGDHLSRNWSNAHVRDTIAGGKFVMRDRKLLNVDERELMLRARAAASRLWERMQGYYR